MRIRKHRHRFVAGPIRRRWQVILCSTRGCSYRYEQGLLFNPKGVKR